MESNVPVCNLVFPALSPACRLPLWIFAMAFAAPALSSCGDSEGSTDDAGDTAGETGASTTDSATTDGATDTGGTGGTGTTDTGGTGTTASDDTDTTGANTETVGGDDVFTRVIDVVEDGTRVKFPGGQVEFFPAAVSKTTRVTISNACPPPPALPAKYEPLTSFLCFQPHGLAFNDKVRIDLSVPNAQGAARTLQGLRAADENATEWEVLSGPDAGATGTSGFRIDTTRFSYYVVVNEKLGGE
jgi:hypothetical protein